MFSKTIFASAAALAFATSGALAKPIERRTEIISSSPISFNNYLGFSSMSNFDDFFGLDNFDSSLNVQNIIVEEQQEELVCDSQQIEIVQQRISILTEVIKQVLLEQVCEVEVQTIVLQQTQSIFESFGNDISHISGRSISYDQNIAGLLGQVVGSDGNLSNNNFGFKGSDVGNNSVVVSGNNWDNNTSPDSVKKAKGLADQASNKNSTVSASSNSTSSS